MPAGSSPGELSDEPIDEGRRYASEAELASLEAAIDGWIAEAASDNPAILHVARNEFGDPTRWFIRLAGETRDVTTLWCTLRQRTFHVEAQVLSQPRIADPRIFELLLRRNAGLYGIAFNIGDEDGIYLSGAVSLSTLDAGVLDRLIGSIWIEAEKVFPALLEWGFGVSLPK